MAPRKENLKLKLEQCIQKHREEEGLSVKSLKDVVAELKQQEEALLASVFRSCATEYATKSVPDTRVDEAAIAFGQLEARIEQKQLHSLAGQHQKVLARMAELKKETDSLRCAAHLQAKLDQFHHFFSSGEVVQAAQCIVGAAESLIQQPGFSEGSDEAHMRDEFAARGVGMAKDLASQVDQSVVCSLGADALSADLRVTGPKEKLSQQWLALKILRESDSALSSLSRKVFRTVFGNNALPKSAQKAKDSGTEKRLQVDLINQQADVAEQSAIHGAVIDTLEFVGVWALGNDEALCKRMGQLLWPSIARIYIQICLKPLTLTNSPNLSLQERQCKAAEDFEDNVAGLGFLAQSDDLTELPPIHAHVQQIKDTLLRKSKLALVSEARDLMLLPLQETVIVGLALSPDTSLGLSENASKSASRQEHQSIGLQSEKSIGSMLTSKIGQGLFGQKGLSTKSQQEDRGILKGPQNEPSIVSSRSVDDTISLLATGEYQISKPALQIVDLIKSSLLQASENQSSLSTQACLSALADIADLYSAVPSTVWSRELEVPTIAALYHNNCFYLAQEMLLQPCYHTDLPESERPVPDPSLPSVLSLREAGQQALKRIVKQQVAELEEILAGAQGFKRITEAKRGLQARKSVQQCLHTLRRLGAVLRPILPSWAFVELGSKLIAFPAASALASVMASTDISVDESEDIPRILDPIATESASAFVGRVSADECPGGLADSQLAAAIEFSCKALQRLQAALEIMGARLGPIRAAWEEGRYKSKGLHAGEVVHLIKALFEQTDLRDAVIDDIESA